MTLYCLLGSNMLNVLLSYVLYICTDFKMEIRFMKAWKIIVRCNVVLTHLQMIIRHSGSRLTPEKKAQFFLKLVHLSKE